MQRALAGTAVAEGERGKFIFFSALSLFVIQFIGTSINVGLFSVVSPYIKIMSGHLSLPI